MKYVYGPVKSRRLGFSLGITTVPYKICSFDCLYCQLKRTTQKTLTRQPYIPEKEILAEVRGFFQHKPKDARVDYITFSGSGEPTLHLGLGRLIKAIRKITSTPIALITNSSSLVDPKLRREVSSVDLIVPSLDAVTESVFKKIDRPVSGLSIKKIIDALINFRKSFKGQMWLEVMLVKGVNDTPAYLKKIKNIVDLIGPDKLQINTPVREPAEPWVKPPSAATLKKARQIFGPSCDIVC